MDERLESNKNLWNALTGHHVKSTFYNVAGFLDGRCTLMPLEREEMGDVKGRSLLHLQCHFGLDTLSWARLGAEVTGADFSDEAINCARKLSVDTSIKADFICADIYALPDLLDKQFDIVFTSYGVLTWLPDLDEWAEIAARYVKPGGFFYIAEIHPMLFTVGYEPDPELRIRNSYFPVSEQERYEGGSDYASDFTHDFVSYEWQWPVSTVVTALAQAGLRIEFVHEFPFCCFQGRRDMQQDKEGWWHLEGDRVPLTYSIKAYKPRK